MDYTLIIPVANSNKNIILGFEQIRDIMLKFSENTEFLFIDDASSEFCKNILLEIKNKYKNVKIVTLKKAQGQQLAITIGLSEAKGDAVIVLPSYLPQPVAALKLAINAYKKGNAAIHGHAKYNTVREFFLKIENGIANFCMRLIGIAEKVWGNADIEVYSRAAVDIINMNHDKNQYMRNVNVWPEFNLTSYYFEYNPNELLESNTEKIVFDKKSSLNHNPKDSVVILSAESRSKKLRTRDYKSPIIAFALFLLLLATWLVIYTVLVDISLWINVLFWVVIIIAFIIAIMSYVKRLINDRLGKFYSKSELDKIE